MRLVKFTLAGNVGSEVFVNPDHVVSVTRFDKYTSILTTGLNRDGDGKRINVTEDAVRVVAMLTA